MEHWGLLAASDDSLKLQEVGSSEEEEEEDSKPRPVTSGAIALQVRCAVADIFLRALAGGMGFQDDFYAGVRECDV
jgi:hypothetical protein